MKCPTCQSPLLTMELNAVELDFCPNEHGVWFDEGELEALFESTIPILPVGKGTEEKGRRRCPRCRAKMRILHPSDDVEIDRCPYGDGIWFDPGEISRLANNLQAQDDASRLPEVFSRLSAIMGES